MRFALLGIDEPTLALARAVSSSDRHELTLVCAESADAQGLSAAIRPIAEWEILLASREQDAVLVAAVAELSSLGKPSPEEQVRLEQVRRLAQEGVPMLVSHPLTHGVLDAYEIEMVAAECSTLVMPNFPLRDAYSELFDSCGDLGEIEQVSLQRNQGVLPLTQVLKTFAHDVDLFCRICGGITKVSALGTWTAADAEPGPLEESSLLRGLGAQLSSPSGTRYQWSPQSGASDCWCEITVRGTRGELRFEVDSEGSYHLQSCGASRSGKIDSEAAAERTLDRFEQLYVEGPLGTSRSPGAAAAWPEAIRSLELTEALARSLRRGRTIEVREEVSSEVGAFKSTMASVGCFLLIAGLVLVVIAAVTAGIARRAGANRIAEIAGYWPWLLVATLVAFLLLQLLRFVIPTEKSEDEEVEPLIDADLSQ